jgi:hypothetical protein
MTIDTSVILAQLDRVLGEWQQLRGRSRDDDMSDQPEHEMSRLLTRLASTIERQAPAGSYYCRSLTDALARNTFDGTKVNAIAGALVAFRQEYELGYTQSFEELV